MVRLAGRITLVVALLVVGWTTAGAQTPASSQTFVIVGEVKSPGGKTWTSGVTVEKAIKLADGVTTGGSFPAVRIRRPIKGRDGTVQGYANVKDISDGTAVLAEDTVIVGRFTGELVGTVSLESGDVPTFAVEGEVNSPGLALWQQGMTVGQAIAAVNGMTSKGKLGYIKRAIRDADGKILRYEQIKQLKPDTVLQQDDILVIARKWFGN
jgi:protein involved in polysaccharide export with SLBB domain